MSDAASPLRVSFDFTPADLADVELRDEDVFLAEAKARMP